jgi:hypothetical protein
LGAGRARHSAEDCELNPNVADLHYRGYSVMHMPVGAGAPEVPDYNQIEGTKQRWRDLIGYYTRYGDVRELSTTSTTAT